MGIGPIAAADFVPRYKYNKKYDEYQIKKEAGEPVEPWVEEVPEPEDGGGGGAFIVILIILMIIGGMAFGFHKYRQK